MAKLQEANTKRAATVFPQPTAPSTSYSARPYVSRGKSFKDKRGFKKPGGRGRGQGRSAPSATIKRPGQSKDGQKALIVSISTDAPQGPRKAKRNFRGDKNKGNKQSGCAPPTSVSSRRETEQLCGGVETYYERSLRSKYRSQGVQTLFYESTPSLTNSLGDQISAGSTGNFGHAGADFPYAPKERDNRGASRLTRVLLERIPGKESFRRVASSYRSKESEPPHPRTSFPYVHDKLCAKLRRKRRLRVQDRSAGCVLSRTDSSKQQEVPQVRLRKQGVPVSSTEVLSKHGHSNFYSFGAYGDSIPAPSGNLGDTISGRLVSSPAGPSSFITTSGSAIRYARPCRFHSESKEIRTGPDSGSPVSRNSLAFGPWESFTPGVQSSGDSCLRTPSILPRGTKLHSSVPASGITQLGLRSYLSGSFVPETSSTSFSFVRSDRPVYATASIRPIGPCQPTSAMAGPTFSYLRNPDPPFSGGPYDFLGRLQAGLGRPHGGFQDFGYLDPHRPQAPHELSGVQSGYSCPTALGSSASGPPGHGRHGQFDSSFIYQQAGGPHSPTLLRLAVDLFLWLESQGIIVRARHIPGCLNVIADHLSRPNQPIPTEWSLHPEIVSRIFRVWGTPEVDMFATLSNSHLIPRFMSPVREPRALAVDALSQDWQGRSMYMFPPFPLLNRVMQKLRSTQAAEVILVAPWWPWWPPGLSCGFHIYYVSVWNTPWFSLTVRIFCPSRTRSTSRTESHTICTYGGSHATLQSSRLFRRGL